ncbi:putative transporter [Colletotrichum siamense]|uniref:Transporter n=1 Tax=Colletotrichum siamense TaxID=690259 RepID=A0A9P5EYH1_COLSI|nr:putative transporter [Colletotrichum siamense]KAF4862044.1 putative transporter [Colletotrichum siamense]
MESKAVDPKAINHIVDTAVDTASVTNGLSIEKPLRKHGDAAEFLRIRQDSFGSYSAKESKVVLRKIDWRLLPLMWITTNLSAIDKIVISNAALYGMKPDLHLVGQEYSWVGSIFYFGFLLGEWPFGPVMQRLPLAKLLSSTILAWGALTVLMGAANNAAGIMTLRFLMGFFEAPLYPMMSIMTVMWYKKSEQPLRVTVWFTSLSSVITGIVSFGIGHTHTAIASWRLLFIVLGGFTLLWGIVLFIFLPDSPTSCKFLDEREKFIAVDRMKDNMTGIHNPELKWYQVKEAFLDWKSWLIVAISILMNIPNGSLVTFAAQIVSGLGYPALQATLLGMPTGVVQTGSAFMVSGLVRITKNKRTTFGALFCLVPMACSVLIRRLPSDNKNGLLVSYYFFYFFWAAYPTIISLPLANTAGHTKKLTVNAMVFTSYCVANIIAPQLFLSSEAPHYPTGYNGILGCEIGAIVCMGLYALGCYLENNRRDRLGPVVVEAEIEDMLDDRTDKEKPSFRYVY